VDRQLTSRRAWDEIHEVFGDGTDFDWALDAQGDGGDVELDDEVKKNLRLEDVRTLKLPILYCFSLTSRCLTQQRSKSDVFKMRTGY
jgi:hypothetical protein